MREYFLEDPLHPNGGIIVDCKYDTDCVFCDHCTDVFWDYSNLIYMIFCDEEHDTSVRPCPHFSESISHDDQIETENDQIERQ